MRKEAPLTEALFYILLSVRKPNHGYGIIQEVEKLTAGRVVLGPGTLYGAIQTMTENGWIRIFSQETDSRKKKEYIVTDLGRQIFAEETKRLAELLRNAALFGEAESCLESPASEPITLQNTAGTRPGQDSDRGYGDGKIQIVLQ